MNLTEQLKHKINNKTKPLVEKDIISKFDLENAAKGCTTSAPIPRLKRERKDRRSKGLDITERFALKLRFFWRTFP